MKETFGQKTRRSHKRNQRVVMFWCAFVFAFVIAGVWLFRGTLFQNDSGASSSGTNQSRHDACGTADSRQKSTDVTQAPMDHEVCQKLQDLVSQDQRVQQVIDNCEIYPEDILKMLSRNLDMLNFVLEYPEKVGQVFAETVGEVEGGEVPLLLQYDQRWGYGDYGNSSVAVSGCGPACLASSGLLSLSSSSRPIFCSRSRRDSRFTCSMYSTIFAGVRVRSISSMT